ncbi:MAG: DUF721 domain-containing protein [Acidobacteriaceae bacterium]|nr:DUF721 domain-containing protein [Acidobacteriaceae bacterium]
MERAARLIKSDKLAKIFSDEDLARAVWPAAVGKKIAAHTAGIRLVRSKLVVEVADAIWQKQLFPLTGQILDRLRKTTGSDAITDIEFRIAVPRRTAQWAHSLDSKGAETSSADEAEAIRDPVLKKLYRLSRKKATA